MAELQCDDHRPVHRPGEQQRESLSSIPQTEQSQQNRGAQFACTLIRGTFHRPTGLQGKEVPPGHRPVQPGSAQMCLLRVTGYKGGHGKILLRVKDTPPSASAMHPRQRTGGFGAAGLRLVRSGMSSSLLNTPTTTPETHTPSHEPYFSQSGVFGAESTKSFPSGLTTTQPRPQQQHPKLTTLKSRHRSPYSRGFSALSPSGETPSTTIPAAWRCCTTDPASSPQRIPVRLFYCYATILRVLYYFSALLPTILLTILLHLLLLTIPVLYY